MVERTVEGTIHVVERTSTNRTANLEIAWNLVPGCPVFLQSDGFCTEPQDVRIEAKLIPVCE